MFQILSIYKLNRYTLRWIKHKLKKIDDLERILPKNKCGSIRLMLTGFSISVESWILKVDDDDDEPATVSCILIQI